MLESKELSLFQSWGLGRLHNNYNSYLNPLEARGPLKQNSFQY